MTVLMSFTMTSKNHDKYFNVFSGIMCKISCIWLFLSIIVLLIGGKAMHIYTCIFQM